MRGRGNYRKSRIYFFWIAGYFCADVQCSNFTKRARFRGAYRCVCATLLILPAGTHTFPTKVFTFHSAQNTHPTFENLLPTTQTGAVTAVCLKYVVGENKMSEQSRIIEQSLEPEWGDMKTDYFAFGKGDMNARAANQHAEMQKCISRSSFKAHLSLRCESCLQPRCWHFERGHQDDWL